MNDRKPAYFCRRCARMIPLPSFPSFPGTCRCKYPERYDANAIPIGQISTVDRTYYPFGFKTASPASPSQRKQARAAQLAALADQVYAASEPVHVPGELDHLDEPQDRDGGPDTWTDAERNR